MAKKIYDIKPPKTVTRADEELKKFLEGGTQKKPRRPRQKSQPKIVKQVFKEPVKEVVKEVAKPKNPVKRSWRAPVFILILCAILIAGGFLYFKLQRVVITITPKVESLTYAQIITADKSAGAVDITNNVIPAYYFTATKTNIQDFPATGNASNEGKASGNITIYNKYDPPTPVTFRAGTHFMSDSGKLFVSFQKISIPAATKSGSKITPGSVQVQVQAVEGGDGYNVAPSNFSIPGLKGTAYYYSVYAVSTQAMEGGYAGKVKKITSDDIQGAKDVLVEKTEADALTDLRSQISDEYVLLENAILTDTSDASTEAKAGQIVDTFSYQSTVTASAIAFKKADIEQFARLYLLSKMPEGKTLLADGLQVDYSATRVDVSGGKISLTFNFSSGMHQSIDSNSLALAVMGQNDTQVKETINNIFGEQVINTSVNFWPFWTQVVPNNQEDIKIELKFQ